MISTKNEKGQSAIEYLNTYGWMLFSVVIIGGAIFSAVQDRGELSNITNLRDGDVKVKDSALDEDGLQLILQNGAREPVNVEKVTLVDPETGDKTEISPSKTIRPGEEERVKLRDVETISDLDEYKLDIKYNSGKLENLEAQGQINAALKVLESFPRPRVDNKAQGYINTSSPEKPIETEWEINIADYAVEVPVIVGDKLFLTTWGSNNVYSINADDGSVVWNKSIIDNGWDDMTYYKGNLYFTTYSSENITVYSVDRETGETMWKTAIEGGWDYGFVGVKDDVVYVGADWATWTGEKYKGRITALDAFNGNKLCHGDIDYETLDSGPSFSDDNVYISTEKYDNGWKGKLRAYEIGSCQSTWSVKLGTPAWSVPLVHDNKVYEGGDGFVAALDSETGVTEWNKSVTGKIYRSIAYDGENIYWTNEDGLVTAANPENGDKIWQKDITDNFQYINSIVIARKTLIISGSDEIYALDTSDGSTKWNYTHSTGISDLSVLNGALYATSGEYNTEGDTDLFKIT